MRLVSAHVQGYRNFVDSGVVEVKSEVTCLVGKNESGKTALLQALHALNPANRGPMPDLVEDYPRWLKKEHELAGTIGGSPVISTRFDLDESDLDALAARFGTEVVPAQSVSVARRYGGDLEVAVVCDEETFVARFVDSLEDPDVRASLPNASRIDEVLSAIEANVQQAAPTESTPGNPGLIQGLNEARTRLDDLVPGGDLAEAVAEAVAGSVPRFFYFGEYQLLQGRSEMEPLVEALKSGDVSGLDPEQATAAALLRLASTDVGNLTSGFEVTTAEIEAVANLLTSRVKKYWRQNPHLRLTIAIEPEYGPHPQGGGERLLRKWLQVRVHDTRHDFTNNLDRRSTGFRWFTSFFAAFFEFEYDTNVIVLLDEPGLHLHGSAQADLLNFINERLTGSHQVVYTSHSPWMVPNDLSRVRIVEDPEDDEAGGARVVDQAATRDPDSLFPLQAALGYDIAQTLFVGADNLAVEGNSDFLYLTIVSAHLAGLGRSHLDDRWKVLPCGGAGSIPAFVSLIGPHLDVTVLTDSDRRPDQRLANLTAEGILESRRVITVGAVLGRSEAAIEDMFTPSEYLKLFNATFPDETVTKEQLQGSDSIVKQIERALGHSFNHGQAAEHFLRHQGIVVTTLSKGTLGRFEQLFERINSTLSAVPRGVVEVGL